MKLKTIYTLCVIIISLICLSCNNREAYYHFKELKNNSWSRLDTLTFDIDSTAILTDIPYNVDLEIVNNTNYEYQNIWFYTTDDFGSKKPVSYEIEYTIADKDGNWYGAGFGSIYQLTVAYKKKFIFTEKRNYTLKIVQGMSDEPLSGIEKIGIKIVPSE